VVKGEEKSKGKKYIRKRQVTRYVHLGRYSDGKLNDKTTPSSEEECFFSLFS
jgi:hypothetical protein